MDRFDSHVIGLAAFVDLVTTIGLHGQDDMAGQRIGQQDGYGLLIRGAGGKRGYMDNWHEVGIVPIGQRIARPDQPGFGGAGVGGTDIAYGYFRGKRLIQIDMAGTEIQFGNQIGPVGLGRINRQVIAYVRIIGVPGDTEIIKARGPIGQGNGAQAVIPQGFSGPVKIRGKERYGQVGVEGAERDVNFIILPALIDHAELEPVFILGIGDDQGGVFVVTLESAEIHWSYRIVESILILPEARADEPLPALTEE
ncbi:MAG: hypothetical protein BWY71_01194 [Planctomycetes bacterium ADurb.Bin412]|nr:MAG: hypothetical protein BWY71_01194 [Planctomycetes bacterium ADurb.Bin412]